MVDRFEFLRDFNIEIFQNCRKAEFMVNTMNDCNLSLNAARTALELLCAEENPDYYQYDSLDEKVRSFVSRTNPDDNICNALKTIKINGNEGSHGNGSIRKAKDSIDLLAQVLIWYVCGYRGKKYKEVDFHPSELRYAYLYCKDLKTISAKPEKAVTNKKVAVEVKNDAVQQDTAPNPANESSQPKNVSVSKATPVEANSPVIDKEEKKRLKLERKAQEEAERKAKRNAERELRKQFQKEQKAKALEEAKRRNEEAVAKANAKLQAQEDKKLAKEKELEQKRIRAEKKAVWQEEKRMVLEENIKKKEQKRLAKDEAIKQRIDELMAQAALENEKNNAEQGKMESKDTGQESNISEDTQQQKMNELKDNSSSILDVLVQNLIEGNVDVIETFLQNKERIRLEHEHFCKADFSKFDVYTDILVRVKFKFVQEVLFKDTLAYSNVLLKIYIYNILAVMSMEKSLKENGLFENNDTVCMLIKEFNNITHNFLSIYNSLRVDGAQSRYTNKKLYEVRCRLKKLAEKLTIKYLEIMRNTMLI